MARAYIVLLRNDLDDNFLQALDLVPNESLRNFPYDPPGQTHYISTYLIDGVNVPPLTVGAGPILIDGDSYGLSSYCIDRVEYTTAVGRALTGGVAGEAAQVAAAIEGLAATGAVLDAGALDAAVVGVLGAGNSLTGSAGNSNGTVEEVLRILAGERYKMPNGVQVENGANLWDPVIGGFFTTAPNVEGPGSVRNQFGAVRGRNPFTGGPVVPLTPPVQTNPEDVHHNFIRPIFDTGDLHRSAGSGALAELKAATFTFLNPDFTYSAAAPFGTATTLDGSAIPVTGQAPAIAIYAADGTVI